MFWHYATSKSKTGERITEFYNRKELAQTDQDKADVLANFFGSVFTLEPVGPITGIPRKTDLCITPNLAEEILKVLNISKPGCLEMLLSRVLKELAEALRRPQTEIYLKLVIFVQN